MAVWRYTFFLFSALNSNNLVNSEDCTAELFHSNNPLDNCDIFNDELTFQLDRLFRNPACISDMRIKINKKEKFIQNPSETVTVPNEIPDKCTETKLEIRAVDKERHAGRTTFYLDPCTCFSELIQAKNFSFEVINESIIHMNVKSEIFKNRNMQGCLDTINFEPKTLELVHKENEVTEIRLDRSKEQMLYVNYYLVSTCQRTAMTRGITIPRAGEVAL